MVQWTWPASLSPGNEQVNRWSSRSATSEGSLNLAGVKNPAADAMIEALLRAESAEEFTAAVRAFDRVLVSGDYVIPLFHLPKAWVAYWSHLKQPGRRPACRLRHRHMVDRTQVTPAQARSRHWASSRRALGEPSGPASCAAPWRSAGACGRAAAGAAK